MKITYYGHACFFIEAGGKRILLDPFIQGNALAEGKVNVDNLRCDYLLLSHAHADHSGDAETVLRNNPEATLIGIWEISQHYAAKGFKTHPMNKGGWFGFEFGRVKMVQAVHSSSFPDGSYGGDPAGFVLDTPDGVLYFAADTALTLDMQLIPLTCPRLDIAILPIGSNFTMDYNDAVIASDFIQCNRVIASHYDTFGYIVVDHDAASAAFKKAGKELIFLPIAEETQFVKQ